MSEILYDENLNTLSDRMQHYKNINTQYGIHNLDMRHEISP
jgi:hypothetical protein